MNTVVEVKDLTKRYGDLVAVNEVSFSIEKGEIFGLLGPNGAGKTTTVEMIEGLRKPDGGTIEVCGIDASKGTDRVKEIIGVQLQSTTIYDKIQVGEVIDLFGGYYQRSLPTAEILDKVSLNDKKDSFVQTLSGGQKQRVAMALALVNDPEVLFLDEPTTGLDPQARRNVWDVIDGLRGKGKTIILTTHYMEEAERLCGRVGIIDHGKIIALNTTRDLIAKQNLESAIEFTTSSGVAKEFIEKLPEVSKVAQDGDSFILHTKKSSRVLAELTRLSEENGFNLENISVRKATLEDVFLALTGRRLRQ
ncbi:Linearmycin resistance ATP-binding protein LnrL [subsurface metagenome]